MNETLTSDHNINIFAIKISNDFQSNNFLQFFLIFFIYQFAKIQLLQKLEHVTL